MLGKFNNYKFSFYVVKERNDNHDYIVNIFFFFKRNDSNNKEDLLVNDMNIINKFLKIDNYSLLNKDNLTLINENDSYYNEKDNLSFQKSIDNGDVVINIYKSILSIRNIFILLIFTILFFYVSLLIIEVFQ
ncbi:MAG: hypothetical protein LBR40_02295 [Bacilli bacterium]|jgi:hypothetical protein|nr:hypothetical protein [Bacilli bacterium]